jgi:hypothetical protein
VESLITLALVALSTLASPGLTPDCAVTTPGPVALESELLFSGIDFFSGEVAEISSASIDVVRSALGKNDQRRFSVNEETKFEGRAKRGSRVTVGYYAKAPDVAVTVIVREEREDD